MLAPLLAYWPTITPPTNNDYDLPGLVLRRINELSASEGKRLILAEMAVDQPRVDEVTLCLLPDKAMPSFDSIFATRLARNDIPNLDSLCRLIARYATNAMLPQVKARYAGIAGSLDCDSQASLLAYLLRVDPDYGVAMVKAALADRKYRGCYHTIFSDITSRRYDPRLIPIARDHLNDPDTETAGDAAKLLRTYLAH